MPLYGYAFQVITADGQLASEHRTRTAAERNARKYRRLSRSGRLFHVIDASDPRFVKKNPQRASVIYAQRKGRMGEVMYYDGKKFSNNSHPKYFGTHDRARGVAQQLVSKHAVLSQYRIWVGPPLPILRRRNPSYRAGLEEAARRLEDFSGHAARKVIRVRPRSNARQGLVIGELDLIGYRTKRDGIGGGKLLRYAHDFGQGSRPLLAVSKDGKQLHIVGGRYEFTEAGIEDR